MTDLSADHITINGEKIPHAEAMTLIRMLCNDAKEIAGVFHGMNRSAKFRANWPNEYEFADNNWKTFVDAARKMYAQRLADPKTPPKKARMMHLALVLQAMISQTGNVDTRLQLAPDTQQFAGDGFENRKIENLWGRESNTIGELLRSSTNKTTFREMLLGSAGKAVH